MQPVPEQESDSQNWNIAVPGFKNFGTGTESEPEKVTPATSARNRRVKVVSSWSMQWCV